jgi:hypothetical protein
MKGEGAVNELTIAAMMIQIAEGLTLRYLSRALFLSIRHRDEAVTNMISFPVNKLMHLRPYQRRQSML